jgi:hypothetical protein
MNSSMSFPYCLLLEVVMVINRINEDRVTPVEVHLVQYHDDANESRDRNLELEVDEC